MCPSASTGRVGNGSRSSTGQCQFKRVPQVSPRAYFAYGDYGVLLLSRFCTERAGLDTRYAWHTTKRPPEKTPGAELPVSDYAGLPWLSVAIKLDPVDAELAPGGEATPRVGCGCESDLDVSAAAEVNAAEAKVSCQPVFGTRFSCFPIRTGDGNVQVSGWQVCGVVSFLHQDQQV